MTDVRTDPVNSIGPQPQPTDYELLRAYEPVLAFTQGEMFFPIRVDGYVRLCSLTARTDSRHQSLVAERGTLSVHILASLEEKEAPAQALSLRFVEEPLGGISYQRWSGLRPEFQAKGRLSRVGLLGRLPDAVFRLTFFLRGRVPGGTTAAAQIQYAAIFKDDPVYAYYGRVLRRGSYTVLNYQFFYAMNDWRSSFFGVNDHEADWEQIFVYLSPNEDGRLEPGWIAYASHDFQGADLRRRWDDPDLTMVEGHPVVFVGAGSHASYFQSGEYVISVKLKLLKPITALTELLRRFWRDTLRQGDPAGLVRGVAELVTVPFVDYARGDGARVGPGCERGWTPIVIDEDVDWVSGYRGLWGLDTRDVFAGELAPAGPRYNRDGSVRQTWYDPIGWAELDRAAPAPQTRTELSRRITQLGDEIIEVRATQSTIRGVLPRLALTEEALVDSGASGTLLEERRREIDLLERDLALAVSKEEQLRAEIEVCERFAKRLQAGYRPGPKAHIRHQATPEPAQAFHEGRIAELWAAASIGLLLVLGAGLISLGAPWFTALLVLIGGSVLVDNILRGTVVSLLLSATIALALIAVLVLVYEFIWWFVLAGLAAAGLSVLTNNLREFGARQARTRRHGR